MVVLANSWAFKYEVLVYFVCVQGWPIFGLVSSHLMVKLEGDSVDNNLLFLGDLMLAIAFSRQKVAADALEGFFSEVLGEAL